MRPVAVVGGVAGVLLVLLVGAGLQNPTWVGKCPTGQYVDEISRTTALHCSGPASPLPVTGGGSGLSAVAADQVFVGTAANTFTAKGLPFCSGTGLKLEYSTTTHAFACGSDLGANAPVRQVKTADQTTISGTAAAVMELGYSVGANTDYSFSCVVITASNNVNSSPRFAVYAPGTATQLTFQAVKFPTSTTAAVHESINVQWVTPCTGCTAAVTAGATTARTAWALNGVLRNGATAGAAQIYFAASQGVGETITVYQGSFCEWK